MSEKPPSASRLRRLPAELTRGWPGWPTPGLRGSDSLLLSLLPKDASGVTCPMLSVGIDAIAAAPLPLSYCTGDVPSPECETKLCIREGCGARLPKPGVVGRLEPSSSVCADGSL